MAKRKAAAPVEAVETNGDPIEFTPAPELEAAVAVEVEASVEPEAPAPPAIDPKSIEGTLASSFVDAAGFCVVRDASGRKHRVLKSSTTSLGGMRVRFVP